MVNKQSTHYRKRGSKTEYGFQLKDETVTILTDEEIQQHIQMKKEDTEDTAIISTMF